MVFGLRELEIGVVCRDGQRLISKELVKKLIEHFKHTFNVFYFNEKINSVSRLWLLNYK